jgi:hypothetical protein
MPAWYPAQVKGKAVKTRIIFRSGLNWHKSKNISGLKEAGPIKPRFLFLTCQTKKE